MKRVNEKTHSLPSLISESKAVRNKFDGLLARPFLYCSIDVVNFVLFFFFGLLILLLIDFDIFFILHS